MKFSIQQEVLDKIKLPYSVAFIAVSGLVAKDETVEMIKAEMESITEPRIREAFSSEELIESERIIGLYKDAFKLFGISGSVSLENMLRQVGVKKKSIVMGDSLINFYNNFVLNHKIPAGAYDLDRIVGNVSLRFSLSDDRFKQLGKEDFELVSDSLVLVDEEEVLCKDWVSKQSETQKIRVTTKNVLFRLEGFSLSKEQLEIEVEHFKEKLAKLFEFDELSVVVLDAENPLGEIVLPDAVEVRRANYVDALELLTRGVSKVIVYEDLLNSLLEGKKLRIKHGVDPTTRDLHLGYAVNYQKMKQFQDRGHTIVFLIGSFTARFGDPTDKGETRQMKQKESVLEMAQNYIRQLSRILDIDKLEVRYNGDWFDKMSAEDLLRLMSEFTVARMLERDMFAKRMKEGKEIGLHEIVYPMLQGYDSVEIESDLTVIGTDQTFNELQARPLQSSRGQTPQNIIAMQLLVGTDGKMKMSQSLGNYIGFDDAPEDKPVLCV